MNTTVNSADEDTTEAPRSELDLLKERARTLGVEFSGNIGIETLKSRIEAKMNGTPDESAQEPAVEVALTREQREQALREKLQAEALVLVRCRIYNLNPSKRDLRGEIVTVRNRYVGTVRKFVPFGEETDAGYHIPKILYDDLKARQFQQIGTKQKAGQIEVKTRMVPEYSLEILPPLTTEELEELALKQAAAQRLGSE